jgi:hypothetical protein
VAVAFDRAVFIKEPFEFALLKPQWTGHFCKEHSMSETNNKLGGVSADTVSTIEQLFSSMNGLGAAIKSAREKLALRSGIVPGIVERLDSYDSILDKQRGLAVQLCRHLHSGDIAEVERLVALINGLSRFVSEDVRDVLSGLKLKTPDSAEEVAEAGEKTTKNYIC